MWPTPCQERPPSLVFVQGWTWPLWQSTCLGWLLFSHHLGGRLGQVRLLHVHFGHMYLLNFFFFFKAVPFPRQVVSRLIESRSVQCFINSVNTVQNCHRLCVSDVAIYSRFAVEIHIFQIVPFRGISSERNKSVLLLGKNAATQLPFSFWLNPNNDEIW